MKKQASKNNLILSRLGFILAIIFTLISCKPFTPAPKANKAITGQPVKHIPPTSFPPLAMYQTEHLNPLDTPQTYIQDSCQYLINRWNRLNAQPGTVVMVVTFNEDILYNFTEIMNHLYDQGFQAINTQQFLSFMERNVKIPPRSVLIIQENNHSANDFNKKFREYWDIWGWPVVNGWVSDPEVPESLWRENMQLEYEGWVDHQAQGVAPDTILSDDSSKIVISRELKGSIDAFAEHYAKNPLAFIWPGGGFGQRPVEAARELGYQLGFTSNMRGPVMYNWVPLSDKVDPERPTFIPEANLHDPLMTIPRYPQGEILNAIDQVRIIGNEAKAYAAANQDAEFEYYKSVCEPVYGRMPTP